MVKTILFLLCLTSLALLAKSENQKCKQICQKLQNGDCIGCYNKCYGMQGSKIYESFEFASCKRKACVQKREMSQINQNGVQYKTEYCHRMGYTHIPEDICILQCCNDTSFTRFTENRLLKCASKNDQSGGKGKSSKSSDQTDVKQLQDADGFSWWVGFFIWIAAIWCCCCRSKN